MVLKRIISCLAMVCIAFLVSCYDVQYDNAADTSWADGLSTKQIVEGMEITADLSTSKSAASKVDSSSPEDTEVEVTWVCPINICSWTVAYKVEGLLDGETKEWTELDSGHEIVQVEVDKDAYKYSFKHCPFWSTTQYIVYYKISMTDHNGGPYENIVSFMVYPYGRELRVSMGTSEAAVSSKIYGHWSDLDCCIFDILHGVNQSVSAQYFTLAPLSKVFFWICSDFTSWNFGNVMHFSNSSYCKVEKVATNSIQGRIVEATIQYKFEDLPIDRLRYEDDGYFDYDDVVFTVDIIKL